MPVGGRPADFPSDMSLARTTTPLIFVGAYFAYVKWVSSYLSHVTHKDGGRRATAPAHPGGCCMNVPRPQRRGEFFIATGSGRLALEVSSA
jgi:hypothetical protein